MLSRYGMDGGNGSQAHMTESRARSVTGAVSVIMKPLRMILNLGKGSALTVAQEWTERTVTAMADICGDNRFELIEKYKQKLLDATNIEDSPEEMAVIDNILFRFWQMGWLNLATDTIIRAAAITEIMEDLNDRSLHDDPGTPEDYAEGYDEGIRNAAAIVLQMPSAQPVAKDINVPVKDCISRASAIETYRKAKDKSEAHRMLVQLPSAQPDIVACGDCIHWICHDRRCGYWNHGVKPLDWCCHAERRSDG